MSLSRLAILGALMEKPMHGYELRKYFEHAYGVFWMINYGSIYPTLKKLEGDGLAKGRTEAIGSVRGRRIYSITPKGKETFLSMLEARVKKEAFVRDEFTLHLFFLDWLDEKVIKHMIKRRIGGNSAILEHIKQHEDRLRRDLPKYRYGALRRGKMHVETEISWLNKVLKEIEEV